MSRPLPRMTSTLGATFWQVSRTVSAPARGDPACTPANADSSSRLIARVLVIGVPGMVPASCRAATWSIGWLVDDLHALAHVLGDGHPAPGQLRAGQDRRGAGQPQVELAVEPGGPVPRL